MMPLWYMLRFVNYMPKLREKLKSNQYPDGPKMEIVLPEWVAQEQLHSNQVLF